MAKSKIIDDKRWEDWEICQRTWFCNECKVKDCEYREKKL